MKDISNIPWKLERISRERLTDREKAHRAGQLLYNEMIANTNFSIETEEEMEFFKDKIEDYKELVEIASYPLYLSLVDNYKLYLIYGDVENMISVYRLQKKIDLFTKKLESFKIR